MTWTFAFWVITAITVLCLLARGAWWLIDRIAYVKAFRAITPFSTELATLRLHKELCERVHQHKQPKKEAGGNQPRNSPSVH